MALKVIEVFVVGEADIAIFAFRNKTTLPALNEGRETTSVLK